MYFPVHNAMGVFPLSFTSRLTVDMDPDPDSEPYILSSIASNNLLCLGVGKCLTLVHCEEEKQSGEVPLSVLDDMMDIEFEHDIASICWGSAGSCLLVADVSGMLHFVAPSSGTILFSHRVIPANASASVLIESISLISASASSYGSSLLPQVLVCCLSNGTLLHISGIPFTAVSGGDSAPLALSPSVLQSLKIQKFATSFQSAMKWLYLPVSSSSSVTMTSLLRVLVIDSKGHLHALQLGREESDAEGSLDSGKDLSNFKTLNIITTASASCAASPVASLAYVDMATLTCPSADLALLLTASGVFQVLIMSTLQIVQSFAGPDFMSPSSASVSALDQFVAMQVFPPPSSVSPQPERDTACHKSENVVMVLFSVSHVEEVGVPTAVSTFAATLTLSSPHTPSASFSGPVASLLLLHQNNLTNLYSSSSSSTPPLCGAVFPILADSSSTSTRLVQWRSASELCILSWDTAPLLHAVSRVQGGHEQLWQHLQVSSSCDDSTSCVLHTDCLSVIGYLMALGCSTCPPPSFVLDHILDAVQVQTRLMEVVAVARVGLVTLCCTGEGVCSALTLEQRAKDAMYRLHYDEACLFANEIATYENCILTAMLHEWHISTCVEDDDVSACRGNSDMRARIIALLPCNVQHTWKECIRSGLLKESSILLHKHMGGLLPASASVPASSNRARDTLLLLRGKGERGVVPLLSLVLVDDLLEWLQADLLPALRDSPQEVLVLCTFLIEVSREAEAHDHHPFNALSAADLAVTLSSSLLALPAAGSEQQEEEGQYQEASQYGLVREDARALRQVLHLQASLLHSWNQKLSFDEIASSGLSGALGSHLLSVSEDLLLEDIATTVRPLIAQFHESLDAMLYEWIHETIYSTVISNDRHDAVPEKPCREAYSDSGSDNDSVDDESGEKDSKGVSGLSSTSASVRHSRLVVVAAAIQSPEIKAKSLLLLLQILPMTADESTCTVAANTTSTRDSDSSAISTLRTMVKDVSPVVTADARDALVEALRTRQLRQLACKYNIQGFDPRNLRQAKTVVNVIIRSNTHMSARSSVGNIMDVLTFVEAYSSSSIDTSGLLTKALLYRIIPLYFSLTQTPSANTVDSNTTTSTHTHLQAAMDCIPSIYLGVVLEDVCLFLVDLVGQLSAQCQQAGDGSKCLDADKTADSEEDRQQHRRVYAAAVSGAITVCSTFLDLRGESLTPDTAGRSAGAVARTKSGKVLMENISTHRNVNATFINAELYSSLKRLRKLSSEFDIYFSLHELNDDIICRVLIQKQAETRAEVLIASMIKKRSASVSMCGEGNQGLVEEENITPVPARLRKLCSLLDVSHIFVYQKMMRYALGRGHLEVGMLIADHLGGERKDALSAEMAAAVGSSSSAQHQRAVEESSTVLDMTMALCGMAAKKAQESKTAQFSQTPAADAYASPLAPFLLSGTLLRLFLLSCPPLHLGRALDLLNSCELVLSVHHRLEGGAQRLSVSSSSPSWGEGVGRSAMGGAASQAPTHAMGGLTPAGVVASNIKTSLRTSGHNSTNTSSSCSSTTDGDALWGGQLQINGNCFMRDGILMSSAEVWGPLLLFLMEEVKRRMMPLPLPGAEQRSFSASSQDIEKLAGIFQRSENHMLAIRVILTTWSSYAHKKQNITTSVLALSRKILLSLHIDTALAVSCLSTVPYDSMVRELRAAVPSIQSDFSRLQTVAKIGENLSQMWDQEELLLVFQTLQTNAKWWHTLVAHGVKVDPRTFQSSVSAQREKAIRDVVPSLLEKTGGNLSLAMDYCSQFDLEASFASLCYIENTLLRAPCGVNEGKFDWATQIRSVATTVDEAMVMETFRKLMRQIHPVDYEKIRFVCTWLLEVLGDDEGEEVEGGSTSLQENTGAGGAEEYHKYLEIATFLSSLSCPAPLTTVTGTPALLLQYQHLPTEYLFRLPLWELVDHPWRLLDPLLLQLPEFATKLVPLCSLLGLERDDFFAKRAKNFYSESLKAFAASSVTVLAHNTHFPPSAASSSSSSSGTAVTSSFTSSLGKEHPIHSVHEIIGQMRSLVGRISVWQWIYNHEMANSFSSEENNMEKSNCGDNESDQAAIQALQAALTEISGRDQNDPTTTVEDSNETTLVRDLHAEILLELVKHNCLCSLRTLEAHHTGRYKRSTIDVLVQHVGNVDDLLRRLFQVSIEQAWLLQLRSLRTTQQVLTTHALMAQEHTPAVVKYLRVVQKVVADVFSFHSQLTKSDTTDAASTSASSSTATTGKSQLEATRHSYIGSLLADVEFGQLQGEGGESERNVILRGGNEAGTGAGLWGDGLGGRVGGANGDLSDVSPSGAELRRREDIFRAFGISALVACTCDEATRIVYLNQLMAVSKGSGARSQRRLTARSKLRAVQAVLFTGRAPPRGDSPVPVSVRSLGGYLFCLAEMQELRLPSTESTLATALGCSLDDGEISSCSPSSSSHLIPNPSPLVSTWLHDEGHHSDVCELARDVLLIAARSQGRSADVLALAPLWTNLFTCMVRNGHVKALVHSLAVCDDKVASLFDNPYLNTQLFRILSRVANDTATRIDQVIEVLTARQSVSTSTTEKTKKQQSDSNKDVTPSLSSSSSKPSQITKTHNVLLLSHNCSVGTWESPPEDVALTSARVARCWELLGKTHTRCALDPTMLYASADEQTHSRREFYSNMQETSLHLLAAAQGMAGCTLAPLVCDESGTCEDSALRDVLAVAAQECAVASFGVLRNLAEELSVLSSSPGRSISVSPREQVTDKWLGLVSFTVDHIVQFLKNSLSASLLMAKTASAGTRSGAEASTLSTSISCKVLEALFAEFPDHIVVGFLNKLCNIPVVNVIAQDENATPPVIVSKSLQFDDDEEDDVNNTSKVSSAGVGDGIYFPFIEEIIRCSACCMADGREVVCGSEPFTQRGKTFSSIFNWIFNSDAHVLKKVSAFIAHLSPLEKKSLLLRLTVFSRQNKKHIHISDSRLDMIRSMIEKNM